MRHLRYLLAGLSIVLLAIAVIIGVSVWTKPLAVAWVDYLFAHFDYRAAYFGPLLCAPILVWPFLVVCYYLGRTLMEKEK